jgi:hypothetical protein
MCALSRRDFLKYSGTGLAGMTLAMHFPFLTPRRAFASGTAWKFGVMSDTQWKSSYPNNGENPMSCAVSIINALNQQFIHHDVRFAIQVGDLCDVESVGGVRSLPTRQAAAEALYNAGIGFFPLRGNHESSATAATEMPTLFPQMKGQGSYLFGARNIASPSALPQLAGLSYSFDYENVRCVMIDQFTRPDGYNVPSSEGSYNANTTDQLEWIDSALSSRDTGSHAFVFSHKNLIGQNHKDNLFGKTLDSNLAARDTFITSLENNGVRYQLGGHDHMHNRSIIKTEDLQHSVGQIITSSNSYKFYTPVNGDDGREIELSQELYSIGYYIFTVDGPRVTVDFYSKSNGSDYGTSSLYASPLEMPFYLRESFGYSLNGKQFIIARGDSFASVQDSFEGTSAKILSGVNNNAETDILNRNLTKTVNTGWSEPHTSEGAASKVLTLWGMSDNLSLYNVNLTGFLPDAAESKESDIYALSLSYDPRKVRPSDLVSGKFGLATRDASGSWIKAVEANFGGTKTFKYGPWRSTYGLGTYGVDPVSKTVWAVVNHDGDFVAKFL